MAEKQCNLVKNGGGMIEYSTTEKLIGTVEISGTKKALYQKTYRGTFGTLSQNVVGTIAIDTFPIAYRLQNYCGWVEHTTGRNCLPYALVSPATNQTFLIQHNLSDGKISMRYYLSNVTVYDDQNYEVTLQYTKD